MARYLTGVFSPRINSLGRWLALIIGGPALSVARGVGQVGRSNFPAESVSFSMFDGQNVNIGASLSATHGKQLRNYHQ